MNQFKTVFAFEYYGYIKNKVFIITTVVLIILAAGVSFIPTLLGLFNLADSSREAAAEYACVIDNYRVHDPALLAQFFPGLKFDFTSDKQQALDKLQAGGYAWVLETDANFNFTLRRFYLVL